MAVDFLPGGMNALRVRYPVKRFQANFDGFTGLYDFSAAAVAATNQNQVLLRLNQGSLYLIERISFFANVNEGDFLEAMGDEATFPFFRLHFQKSASTSIYEEPVRCVNYLDALEQLVFFQTSAQNESLLISFGGSVGQSAGMVGIDPVFAEVNFTIYQILNQRWIKDFATGKMPSLNHYAFVQA